ncbi:MAG TPA: hypothetical protein VKT27_11615 [Candidatus Binataceae bacterium]|nr:hypothetical protein [Candidatus Binataceae bacterium]
MNSEDRLAIILASSDRKKRRLSAARIGAAYAPDQFRRSVGGSTVFEQTRRRVALAFSAEQTMIVVTRSHTHLYEDLLSDVPPSRLVVQPRNRGTAAATLYALLHAEKMVPNPTVAVFPSHHYVGDDAAFMRHVDLAFEGVRVRPDLSILLGASPGAPGDDYCWIEMGERVYEYLQLFQIRNFWQKPSHALAMRLWQAGCLWNSSIVVARLPVLLALMRKLLPQLAASFDELLPTIGTEKETGAVEAVYDTIIDRDFSHEVSAKHPQNLAVLPVSGIEWKDLEKSHPAIVASLPAGTRARRQGSAWSRRRRK